MKVACVVAGLIALSTPASAQQTTTSFRINGVRVEIPIPDGYCVPQGPLADFAVQVAAADSENVTHSTLVDCRQQNAPPLADYILIKTPIRLLGATVTRERLLTELGAAIDALPSEGNLLSEERLETIEQRLSSTLGGRINLNGAQIRPLGRDSICVYIGGTMTVAGPSESVDMAGGICVTTVADRVITINWYKANENARAVPELLARARLLASRARGRPEP